MPLHFFKYQGCGNDFVLIEGSLGEVEAVAVHVPRLCDRRFGIGCDQVLYAVRGGQGADLTLFVFNSDGSRAGMCGNGLRCVALHAFERMGMTSGQVTVAIGQTRYRVQITRDSLGRFDAATVNMGQPGLLAWQIPMAGVAQEERVVELAIPGPILDLLPADWSGWCADRCCSCVSMGNPHVVFFGHRPFPREWLEHLGARIEQASCFPERANVHFAWVEEAGRISMLTWERGAGATLACGSGACAVLVASAMRGLSSLEADIVMPGGTVRVKVDEASGNVLLTGPAACTFEGTWGG